MKYFSLIILMCWTLAGLAQTSTSPAKAGLTQRGEVYLVDLPTVLRLAKARSLDVQIAREKLNEAKANKDSATMQYFPWLSPGITYHRHDDFAQTVQGQIIEVHDQSWAPGGTIGAQLNIGEAIYKTLAARQQVEAQQFALEWRRQEAVSVAVQLYFDLLLAQSAADVANEAITITTNQAAQAHEAVAAGLLFAGDEWRLKVQREREELAFRRALEGVRTTSARLAQSLHLDPAVELAAENPELVPINLVETNLSVGWLAQEALTLRPELKQGRATVAAARETKKGASYGPLIPSFGAQVFLGGLGGDSDAGPSRFGGQEDYLLGLSWKIGPGGMFDTGRTRAAEAQLKSSELSIESMRDEISRQVVEASVRVQSLRDQIEMAKRGVTAAGEGVRLSQTRKELAVGVVLENIQAQQDLTRARLDYLRAVAEFNKAQYALTRALGKL